MSGSKKTDSKLTARQLRESVYYNPKTGLFSRKWKTKPTFEDIGSKKKHGYIVFQVCGHRDYAHRFAWFYMTGKWPNELDHINGNGLDNRWLNLREATRAQNNGNRRFNPNKKHNHLPKGVIQRINKNGTISYYGRIVVNNKQICSPMQSNPDSAHELYMALARKHFGEFARAK